MSKRYLKLISGEYYHLYNRGNNRENIFLERENYLFFLKQLRKYLLTAADVSILSDAESLSYHGTVERK